LTYVDRIKLFEGNHFTAFGTALHTMCENQLNEVADAPSFDEVFISELQKLPEAIRTGLKRKDIEDMRDAGKRLAPAAIPALYETFGEFELIATEENLMEPIDGSQLRFKGFIDLVIKTPDGKFHVIDWKTCSWGWNAQRRADPMTTYQLTYYKHFYAQKFNVDPSLIETHFALLKRTAKKDLVEIFRVTSGQKKTENALNLLNRALYNINNKTFIKNKLSCSRCEFNKTKHCP
jgi:ATP-dependent exoDNAse (exonuclease V) beta subunit